MQIAWTSYAGRLDEAVKLMVKMSSRSIGANRVTFNELLRARVLAKDMAGAWMVLEHMKSANTVVTYSILLKCLNEHTPPTRRQACLRPRAGDGGCSRLAFVYGRGLQQARTH